MTALPLPTLVANHLNYSNGWKGGSGERELLCGVGVRYVARFMRYPSTSWVSKFWSAELEGALRVEWVVEH